MVNWTVPESAQTYLDQHVPDLDRLCRKLLCKMEAPTLKHDKQKLLQKELSIYKYNK